ncbi:MAG: shikimate dehydrogenase [Magnetococcales bacterium]|nr:shikimate dehydrogenase [Magnetococcales bacterium]
MRMNINGSTRLLAVLGDPVAHSLSPAMHNFALSQLGLNYCYLPFPVQAAQLRQAVDGLVAQKARGFNATIPHKEALFHLVDRLDEGARAIGAVNTVVIDDEGTTTGYNSDSYGFVTALEQRFPGTVAGCSAVIIGAGGATKAVVMALLMGGAAQITIANRTLSRSEALLQQLSQTTAGRAATLCQVVALAPEQLPLERCTLLINSSSVGMRGEPITAVDVNRLPDQAVVYDLIYRPAVTPLLAQASARGLRTFNGLGMLIHQGARAFQLWTGAEMPVAAVTDYLIRHQ